MVINGIVTLWQKLTPDQGLWRAAAHPSFTDFVHHAHNDVQRKSGKVRTPTEAESDACGRVRMILTARHLINRPAVVQRHGWQHRVELCETWYAAKRAQETIRRIMFAHVKRYGTRRFVKD